MKFTMKTLAAAAALLAIGGAANATIRTFSVGAPETILFDPNGSGRSASLELLQGGGKLVFTNPGVDYSAFDSGAIGGAVGALNTGVVSLSGGGGIVAEEEWKSYGSSGPGFESVIWGSKAAADADPENQQYYAAGDISASDTKSFRLSSAANAPVNSISAKIDNIGDTAATAGISIGSVVTAISSGYALQSATANAALTGGNIRIENIVFDLYNGQVSADVSGTRLAVGKAAAINYAPQNIVLWTFAGLAAGGADLAGPTGVDVDDLLATNNIERLTNPTFCGTQCYTLNKTEIIGGRTYYTVEANTTIRNLDMTDAGINFFKSVLNTTATGTSALVGVDNAPGKWGTVQSKLVLRVSEVPEPSTYALMGLGLVGIALVARRRRVQQ